MFVIPLGMADFASPAGVWRKVDFRLLPWKEGLKASLGREWLLSNGIGGYSSSTVPLLNTRKYHGLLVASLPGLRRFVCLHKLDEELSCGSNAIGLGVEEFAGALKGESFEFLKEFTLGQDAVMLKYDVLGVEVLKTVRMVKGFNAVSVSYSVENPSESPVSLKVNVLANLRNIHDLRRAGAGISSSVVEGRAFALNSDNCSLVVYSDGMEFTGRGHFWNSFKYAREEERGEASVEDSYCPGFMTLKVRSRSRAEALVTAVAGASVADVSESFKKVLAAKPEASVNTMQDSGIFALFSNAESFIVDVDSKKSVIAGYHWFSDWGRDTMISLPGLTLVHGRFDEAERILERFLNKIHAGRIPTRFEDGQPQYYDFDGTLWAIDRVEDYLDYAGVKRAKPFLHTYWWDLKDVVGVYVNSVKDGLLANNSGTWMDTLQRDCAVEVQGLWYNALKTMESLAKVMGDEVDYHEVVSDFEANFMAKFWNGSFLRDTLEDGSLRPNQVIMLSMDYCPVPEKEALSALDIVEKELLTPCGLRTLARGHKDYAGRYAGNPAQRERAYHNGSVWPWLLGPYIKACVKYKKGGKDQWLSLIKPLLENHLLEAGLGTVSELFDAEPPHTPRGCISQAWSVAELIRAYYEDIEGKKPKDAL